MDKGGRYGLLHRGLIKALRVEKLRAGKVKEVVEGKITKEVRLPLARDSVRIILATLRAMLDAAVEHGIIVVNPSNRLGRSSGWSAPLRPARRKSRP